MGLIVKFYLIAQQFLEQKAEVEVWEETQVVIQISQMSILPLQEDQEVVMEERTLELEVY